MATQATEKDEARRFSVTQVDTPSQSKNCLTHSRSLCPDPFLYLRAPYVDAVVCTSAPLQKVDFWRQLRRFYVCRIQIHIFGIAPVAGRSWLRHLFGRSSGAQLRSGDPSGPDNASDIAPSLASLLPQGEALDHHRSHRSGARGALDSCIFCPISKCYLGPSTPPRQNCGHLASSSSSALASARISVRYGTCVENGVDPPFPVR